MRKLKLSIFILSIMIFAGMSSFSANASTSLDTSSPDQNIKATVILDNSGALSYSVTKNNTTVIETSKLGIKTNAADFTSGMSLVSTSTVVIDETYSLIQSKQSNCRNYCTQREIVLSKNSQTLKIYLRVYNDGIAYRYYIPGTGNASISEEISEFNLPDGTGGWAFNWRNDYEGLYEYKSATQFSSADFAMPVLASVNNNAYWVLLTEGNVYNADGSYCTSHLHGSSGQNMKVVFAPEQTTAVTTTYPFQTPYRVAIIAQDLNTLATSNLVTNLNPASIVHDTSWIKPGKAAWSWWSEERSPQWFERQKDYVDFASRNNWEYVTVDAGWDDSWVQPLCEYAAQKNVGIFVWTDVGAIDTQAEIDNRLTQWAAWGVKGIKVDFMMDDSQTRMKTYQMIAEKAANLKLMVNFHGSTKPTGEIRTWPHVITTEGIRGSEHYKWSDYPTAYQNCTVPFTRNVIGPMDFTPTVISTANLNTTHAHQLALSVVFESGIQHMADSIDSYEAWKGTSFLNVLPVSWDEMKVLEGFPGDYATIARRNGEDWFIGAITNQARTTQIPLNFLGDGTYTANIYKDGAEKEYITINQIQVTKDSILQIPLANTGGCAVRITKQQHSISIPVDPTYTYYEAESAANTLTGSAQINSNDNSSNGQKVGYLGGSQSGQLQFNNISAATGGAYKMKIHYLSGDTRDIYYSVNGGAEQKLTLPTSGSFNTVRTASINIILQAGTNVIKFYNNSGYAPDIDKIGLKPGTALQTTIYEAESTNNTLAAPAQIYSSTGCSGGAKVGYIGYNGTLQFNNVTAQNAGAHLLRIYYLCDSNRDVYISVNNGTGQKVICFDSGSFDKTEYKEVLVQLNAGNNTINLYNTGGYAPDIDKIEVVE